MVELKRQRRWRVLLRIVGDAKHDLPLRWAARQCAVDRSVCLIVRSKGDEIQLQAACISRPAARRLPSVIMAFISERHITKSARVIVAAGKVGAADAYNCTAVNRAGRRAR